VAMANDEKVAPGRRVATSARSGSKYSQVCAHLVLIPFFFYETFVLIPEIPATAHTSLCVRAARILAGYYPKFIRDLVSQMVCSWT
jgi:hypothetical protein